jgi:hypothetical protein
MKHKYIHGHSRARWSHLQMTLPTWSLAVRIGCTSHHTCVQTVESRTCPHNLPPHSIPILAQFYLCNIFCLYKFHPLVEAFNTNCRESCTASERCYLVSEISEVIIRDNYTNEPLIHSLHRAYQWVRTVEVMPIHLPAWVFPFTTLEHCLRKLGSGGNVSWQN